PQTEDLRDIEQQTCGDTGVALDQVADRSLREAQNAYAVGGGVHVCGTRLPEQEGDLAEDVPDAHDAQQLVAVPDLESPLEHDKPVPRDPALLEQAVARLTLDDVAVAEAAFGLLVAEAVERRRAPLGQRADRAMHLAPVGVRRAQALAHDAALRNEAVDAG